MILVLVVILGLLFVSFVLTLMGVAKMTRLSGQGSMARQAEHFNDVYGELLELKTYYMREAEKTTCPEAKKVLKASSAAVTEALIIVVHKETEWRRVGYR